MLKAVRNRQVHCYCVIILCRSETETVIVKQFDKQQLRYTQKSHKPSREINIFKWSFVYATNTVVHDRPNVSSQAQTASYSE